MFSGGFVKLARPAQRTLDELPKPASAQKGCKNERKKRPRKTSVDSIDAEVAELCKSHGINDEDVSHILECLGICRVDDFLDMDSENLVPLSLDADTEKKVQCVIMAVKDKRSKANPKLSPTSVVIGSDSERRKRRARNVKAALSDKNSVEGSYGDKRHVMDLSPHKDKEYELSSSTSSSPETDLFKGLKRVSCSPLYTKYSCSSTVTSVSKLFYS